MALHQMDISFLLNDSAPSPCSTQLHYASDKEAFAAKAAQDGTLSPQMLHDVVRLATGSAKLRNSVSPRSNVLSKKRPKRSTEVYRINRENGQIERREDMDSLIKLAADTYEPGRKVRRFLCFCDKWYNKREHLNRHVQLVHMGHRPFRCDICNVSFGTKQNMDVHFNTNKHKKHESTLSPRHGCHDFDFILEPTQLCGKSETDL